MNPVIQASPSLPGMCLEDIDKVSRLEARMRDMEQVPISTTHHFHGGMYFRTIMIPANVGITGALIKIATMLIVSGHVTIYVGGDSIELSGYHLLPGSAGRKQVFAAHADTYLTMAFPTRATTVAEVEAEFTGEVDLLMSHQSPETIIVTGE